jgi:hypothetical protein
MPSSGGGALLNKGKLWWRQQTNNPDLAVYMSVAKQVVDEKVKALTGAKPAETERAQLLQDYDPTKGTETIRAVLNKDSKLIEGRAKALQSYYKRNVSKYAPEPEIFSEEAKAVKERFEGKTSDTNNTPITPRPAGMSNTDLIKRAQAEIDTAVSKGADRTAATKYAQDYLRQVGAL